MTEKLKLRTDLDEIPFEEPVLVFLRAKRVPVMAIRKEFDRDSVDTLLGSTMDGYGWPMALDDLRGWCEVMNAE